MVHDGLSIGCSAVCLFGGVILYFVDNDNSKVQVVGCFICLFVALILIGNDRYMGNEFKDCIETHRVIGLDVDCPRNIRRRRRRR